MLHAGKVIKMSGQRQSKLLNEIVRHVAPISVLGIDVSKNTFDTNLGAGTKARSKSFANSPDGWHHLIAWLGEHKIGQVHACLEATGRHGLCIALALHEACREHRQSRSDPRLRADEAGAQQGRGAAKPVQPISLRPGTRLVREWRGVTHMVLIHADGIEWRGQRYRSLTIVARKITGAHWPGPRFFGLRRQQPDTTSSARENHATG
jgi:Protein of unknown function (DUF2924)